jgi:hypothetical protein
MPLIIRHLNRNKIKDLLRLNLAKLSLHRHFQKKFIANLSLLTLIRYTFHSYFIEITISLHNNKRSETKLKGSWQKKEINRF